MSATGDIYCQSNFTDPALTGNAISLLGEYVTLTKQLFESFERLQQNRPLLAGPPETLLSQIIALDSQLTPFLDKLEHHHNVYQDLKQTRTEIEQHNLAILTLIKRLQTAEQGLEAVLANARDRVQVMRETKQKTLDPAEIIAYAQRISRYTSPLPGSRPDEAPKGWYAPHELDWPRSLLINQDRVPIDGEPVGAQTDAMTSEMDVDFSVHGHAPAVPPQQHADDINLDLDL
ncbi:hypothetical protein HK097_007257 [Rhizophlyctis rosea]|uniref:Mediator of RNA polymerase II transcription subunit 4 n=1 Tax=Rhizophlyctis rosea TaxID=64517 RepID=A0AAD5X4P8_9FUNG|nr:hypothetical protein HK097_007257 [Rhizophlyctis rosea]